MNIRFLEAFIWVARLHGFRAAAEKLNVSQATISSRIATLESELDCKLFERKGNAINLSDKGLLLLEDAERVLAAERTLKQNMTGRVARFGRLRIGVIESVVHTWLGDFLSAMRQQYPELEFELTVETTPHLQQLFRKGALDLIFQTEPVLGEGINNTPLTELALAWVCRADNPLAIGEVSLAEIGCQQVISFARGTLPHLSILAQFEQHDIKPQQIHCVTSIAAINLLVVQGLGVATIPHRALQAEPRDERIVVVNTKDTPEPLKLVASWYQNTGNGVMNEVIQLAKAASANEKTNQS